MKLGKLIGSVGESLMYDISLVSTTRRRNVDCVMRARRVLSVKSEAFAHVIASNLASGVEEQEVALFDEGEFVLSYQYRKEAYDRIGVRR